VVDLVGGEDVDAALVALLPRPRSGQEGVDDGQTLFAAICSPLPEPPSTMPRLPGSATTRRAASMQNAG
jgi:hypothetical protein